MDDNKTTSLTGRNPNRYALSGKIMLSSIVIMFTVVILIVCFHSYARWLFFRGRHRRSRRRSGELIVHSDPTTTANNSLDPSLLKSLPTFLYSSTTHDPLLECAVCLSEFEEDEQGRLLPKCNHSFHIECIDMWFHSHSNCPLCRAPVQLPYTSISTTEKAVETIVFVNELACTEAESSNSGLCSSSDRGEDEMGFSVSWPRVALSSPRCEKKPLELVGISVEVPKRNGSCGGLEELGWRSPGGHQFKSPGSGILSLKRIWSI